MTKEKKKSFLSKYIDTKNPYHWVGFVLFFLGIIFGGAIGAVIAYLGAHVILKFTGKNKSAHLRNIVFCLFIYIVTFFIWKLIAVNLTLLLKSA